MPEHAGEWPDWWANGTAAPRASRASRAAKRSLAAARPRSATRRRRRRKPRRVDPPRPLPLRRAHWRRRDERRGPLELRDPGPVRRQGQARLEADGRAPWLLARRSRARTTGAGPGLHVANPAPAPYTGWARVAVDAFREPSCRSTTGDGRRYALSYEAGFEPWGRPQKPEDLSRENHGRSVPRPGPQEDGEALGRRPPPRAPLAPASARPVEDAAAKRPVVETGPRGWPAAVRWDGMRSPLFTAGFGDFVSTQVEGFAPRSLLADLERNRRPRRARGAARERSSARSRPRPRGTRRSRRRRTRSSSRSG